MDEADASSKYHFFQKDSISFCKTVGVFSRLNGGVHWLELPIACISIIDLEFELRYMALSSSYTLFEKNAMEGYGCDCCVHTHRCHPDSGQQ